MGIFYQQLFCYLCNFIHPETGFDLINEKEQIFIKLKQTGAQTTIMQRKASSVS